MKIQLGEIVAGQTCTVEFFPVPGATEPRGCVIVLPGGGYAGLAPHEAEPIAERFNAMGFHAVLCRYRVRPATYPTPLEDARRAVAYTRSHAAEWGIKPDKIALLGFSAGGHLAAMTAQCPGSPESRPDATILCYAVLSAYANLGSYRNLFGNTLEPEDYQEFDFTDRVDATTPPAFIWHTADDNGVASEYPIRYALNLRQYGTPFDLHIFANGVHGLGLGKNDDYPEVRVWPELCAAFLRRLGW